MSMGVLIDIDEFIRIEEHAAEREEIERLGGGEFGGRCVALEAELKGSLRSFGSFGEVAGLLEHEFVVGESQRLQGGGGLGAGRREVRGIGTVQGGHELMRRGAHDEAVDAATPQLGFIGRDVVVDGCVGLGVVKVAIAGAAASEVEFAADGENGVTQRFGIQTARVLAPDQPIRSVRWD